MMALKETVSRIIKGFIFIPWMNMLIDFMLHKTLTNDTILAFEDSLECTGVKSEQHKAFRSTSNREQEIDVVAHILRGKENTLRLYHSSGKLF